MQRGHGLPSADAPYCIAQTCVPACTGDFLPPGELGDVCVDGKPYRLTAFCGGGDDCLPLRRGGEPCLDDGHCDSYDCSSDGICMSEQGETCTPESCYGDCVNGGGTTYCISQCNIFTLEDCDGSNARGLAWRCIGFGRSGAGSPRCVPEEACDAGAENYTNPCSTFDAGWCVDGYSRREDAYFSVCVPADVVP